MQHEKQKAFLFCIYFRQTTNGKKRNINVKRLNESTSNGDIEQQRQTATRNRRISICARLSIPNWWRHSLMQTREQNDFIISTIWIQWIAVVQQKKRRSEWEKLCWKMQNVKMVLAVENFVSELKMKMKNMFKWRWQNETMNVV